MFDRCIDLVPGNTYLYRVRAKDYSGNLSEDLTEYSVTIPFDSAQSEESDKAEIIETPLSDTQDTTGEDDIAKEELVIKDFYK